MDDKILGKSEFAAKVCEALDGTYGRAEKINPGIVKKAEDKQKEMINTHIIKSTNNHSQVKKDEEVASRIPHLEPRSISEEDKNKLKCKTKDADNQPDSLTGTVQIASKNGVEE